MTTSGPGNLSWLRREDSTQRVRALQSCALEVYQHCVKIVAASIERERLGAPLLSTTQMALVLGAAQCCQSLATVCLPEFSELAAYADASGEFLLASASALSRESAGEELRLCALWLRQCRELCLAVATA